VRRSVRPFALLAALLLASGQAGRAEPDAAEITLLSYNTRGLPSWVAQDAPEQRSPRIGALLRGFDVVLLQEDFAHHEPLRQAASPPWIARGNDSRFAGSWWCAILCPGSGLTLLSRLGEQGRTALANVAYRTCAGWLGGANDCWATKGFQHARLALPGERLVHLVNTHLDAGSGAEDRAARASQLEQLTAWIEAEIGDDALVLGGDLNLDAAQADDRRLRDAFVERLRLADSGARAAPGTPWRILDYIFVRSGGGHEIEVLEAGEEHSFVHAGAPLSDHPALFARLRIR
jgi:endonuclease/exonuclease/phosphatase family metal-dependent hydrolase